VQICTISVVIVVMKCVDIGVEMSIEQCVTVESAPLLVSVSKLTMLLNIQTEVGGGSPGACRTAPAS